MNEQEVSSETAHIYIRFLYGNLTVPILQTKNHEQESDGITDM